MMTNEIQTKDHQMSTTSPLRGKKVQKCHSAKLNQERKTQTECPKNKDVEMTETINSQSRSLSPKCKSKGLILVLPT